MGPRAGLDGCGNLAPHRDSIPVPSSPYRLAIPSEVSRPPTFTDGKYITGTFFIEFIYETYIAFTFHTAIHKKAIPYILESIPH